MKEIKIKIDPVPKPRMTKSDRWKGRKVVLQYWDFKDNLKRECSEKKFELGDAYQVVFSVPMPKGWSKKKKERVKGSFHKARPDVDNLIKALNDSLKEENDSSIYHVDAKKIWDYEGSIYIVNKSLK